MFLREKWRQRWPFLAIIILLQLLYFPLNQKSSTGVRLDMPIIDGAMPLVGEFVIIYVAGIVFFCAGAFIMAAILPQRLFQAYVLTHLTVMLAGFLLWMLIPAYVYKAPFVPADQFDVWTQNLHVSDSDYGNQNAFPSSHVYYITVLLFFITKRFPKSWFICSVFAILNVWSTLLTHQHYVLDAIAGLFLTYAGIWLTYRVYFPKLAEWEKEKTIPFFPKNKKISSFMTQIGYLNLMAGFLGWDIATLDGNAHEENAQYIEH